jgi:GH15 family glucan-1,4-alpha-glucosidase
MSSQPIAAYALLSDCQGAALVDRQGSVDWLCLPRFDSPAIFGRLLDTEAGHWSLRPSDPCQTHRRYLHGTLVMETTFQGPTGEARLTDALATGPDDEGHALGAHSPHVLLRELHGLRGRMGFGLEYAPRPEYGLVVPLLHRAEYGVLAYGGASLLLLTTPWPIDLAAGTGRKRFEIEAGERLRFALQVRTTSQPRPRAWRGNRISARLAQTVRAWRTWAAMHQRYEGPYREQVWLGGRVLQALTYQPTGAIVAAPTTSLPETSGGVRNWDYRYTWVRDASLTLDALWVAACPDESEKFFRFMAHASFTSLQRERAMQVMFGIGGEHDLSERQLPRLRGWRQSRPVRIGNAAWRQRQIDVYGELLAAAARLQAQMAAFDDESRQFLVHAANQAVARWVQPDQGIWEVRGPPRHFLYSKLMCWVAVDRAIAMVDRLRAHAHLAAWCGARERIRRAILEEGWSRRAGAFTQSFGSDALDASSLMLPIVGFLPATDPRMRATVAAIERDLSDTRGLLYRYRSDDGLAGSEGSFLLCSFWLAHARALAGQLDQAQEVFERAASHANDVGLLSEEVDSRTGELLGNFPQAFSHIGLINAAWAIQQAGGEILSGP